MTTVAPEAHALLPHDVVTEIASARESAINLYQRFIAAVEEAHSLRDEAEELLSRVLGGEPGWPYVDGNAREVEALKQLCTLPDGDQVRRVAGRLIDLRVWTAVIERTELLTLMDKEAKDDMRAQMRYVPEQVDRASGRLINEEEITKALPPATEENILATIEQFREEAREIWLRGIANAFAKLDPRFRSHDGFKVGNRIILTRCFDEWGTWSYSSRHRDTLYDIERIFLLLDGRHPRELRRGIVDLVQKDRADMNVRMAPRQSEHEGDYFKLRVFKNGNVHLWFSRDDLVERVNRLLAEYYGAALGYGRTGGEEQGPAAERERAFTGAAERAPATSGHGGLGFYPTPAAVARRVVESARLGDREPLTILEPSAGTGNLAQAVIDYRAAIRASTCRITCVELDPERAAGLRRSPYARVLCRNFLELEAGRDLHPFDRVIMNPPFDRLRDVEHVHHALGFLAPGGRLVAVVSSTARYSDAKKARLLRELVEAAPYRVEWRELPVGAFRKVGATVNTELLIIDRRTEDA